ncbi:ubiquitin domain-containing protein [Cavenderia fasciculata]|uniref:Ubiquitin domain-containing protein n=1 Tax=Cavenderia fasciculata TaxID=261658 RepID=F4QDE1_CACFS|nr:ubiquitin domain-containing protein [Cavenderia fasciculata]EGG13769.1 ubiquitin domain-containing protein [Cavenderia fasciculata]|eukprot:XP_004350477.1 ubiquitin domain-containing protein [Cavenderia fasciculata]
MVASSEPPTDIKNIIKKTVEFYVKLGDSFIEKIREREKNNEKFNFLKLGDQYHQYYINVRETELQKQPAKPAAKPAAKPTASTSSPTESSETTVQPSATPTTTSSSTSSSSSSSIPAELLAPPPPPPAPVQEPSPPPEVIKEIYEPEPLLYILDTPEEVNAVDLDTIRLTAQYVAVNGESFSQGLALREIRNTQFDFLKPTHHLHSWYRALVESYAAIVYAPKNICEVMAKVDFRDKQTIVERSINRFEWNQKEQVAAKKAEEEADQERTMFASIDWHDFVVVDTIDFTNEDLELLPSPKTFEELLKISEESLADDNGEGDGEMDVDMDMEDVDMDGGDKEPEAPTARPKLKVVKDYTKAKTVAAAGSEPKRITQPCPMCGQDIPLDEMQEHMRIELLNRRDRPKNPVASGSSTVLHDDEISRNLQSFANRRTDIFGDQEVAIGSAVKEEEKVEKVIWDGHSSSINRTQHHALQIASERIQKHQQHQQQQHHQMQHLHQQHQQHPNQMYIPPYGVPPPPLPPFMQNQTIDASTMESSSQQPNKKLKTDDNLINEEEFIFANPGPVSLVIESTGSDGSNQNYSLVLQPRDTITTLKDRIKDLVGLAPNKQKLKSLGQSILKDQHTLGFYNLLSGTVINVSAKERGVSVMKLQKTFKRRILQRISKDSSNYKYLA